MIYKLAIFFLLLFSSNILFAQDNKCNCLENLGIAIQKTEENYAGYPAKVNSRSVNEYKQLVVQLKQKALPETNAKACYNIIKQYIHFFKDKHFILSYYNPKNFDSTVITDSGTLLTKDVPAAVEGVWVNPDSTTKIVIQKAGDGTFKGIKIESKNDSFPAGFVYFTLTPKGNNQYTVKEYQSFVSTITPAKQNGNLLQLWNHAMWGRVYPKKMSAAESAELATWKGDNKGLTFKKLNKDFTYIKIPTFFNNDDKIQHLIAENDSVIRHTKYLVVDLTGNGGGNTGWVYLLPYFMTNPIVQRPSFVRVTPDNVKSKLADIEPYVKNPIGEEYKKYFPGDVLNMYKKAYAELPVTREPFYPVPGVTFPLDSIMKKPEKVGLVVDNFCGSSAEYFFFLTKQSKKTVTYGTNTIGMMDYEGMSTPTRLPYDKFILTIPIVKSSWTNKHPIDQMGFTPDVIINKPQNMWVDYIIEDLPKR